MLVNTCTLTPVTNSKTGAFMTTAIGTPVTGVACNIQTMSSREAVLLGRETGTRLFNCYFLPTVTIDTRYRISAVTGSSIAGLASMTLTVIGPPVDHSGRGRYVMVPAEEAQA